MLPGSIRYSCGPLDTRQIGPVLAPPQWSLVVMRTGGGVCRGKLATARGQSLASGGMGVGCAAVLVAHRGKSKWCRSCRGCERRTQWCQWGHVVGGLTVESAAAGRSTQWAHHHQPPWSASEAASGKRMLSARAASGPLPALLLPPATWSPPPPVEHCRDAASRLCS